MRHRNLALLLLLSLALVATVWGREDRLTSIKPEVPSSQVILRGSVERR